MTKNLLPEDTVKSFLPLPCKRVHRFLGLQHSGEIWDLCEVGGCDQRGCIKLQNRLSILEVGYILGATQSFRSGRGPMLDKPDSERNDVSLAKEMYS